MCAPLSLSLFVSRATTSFSLSSTSLPPPCPRCDAVDGYHRSLDPNVSFPFPLLSPSLPFTLPSARGTPAPTLRRAAPAAPLSPLLSAASSGLPHRRAALAAPLRACSPIPARSPSARHLKFSLISFKFSIINMLRRALRRMAIYFKFRFISVPRRALRRVTIYFNFRLFNVLCRAFSSATFCFKFSSSGVCRRALRRATLYIIFIFNSSVSWRDSSRDNLFNFSLV
jgi:hypothetical protein